VDSTPAQAPSRLAAGRLVGIVVVAASWLHAWSGNLADEDLWTHLHFGELKLRELAVPTIDRWSYSAAGHPWFNHEWGAEVVFALVFRAAGAAGLFAVKLAVAAVVLAAMLDAARTLARASGLGSIHAATWTSVLVLALAAIAPGASFRPQLFTMACLALEWQLLERADQRLFSPGSRRRVGWELALVPLVLLVWTNAHGGFPVGVGLLAVFVAGVCARALLARRLGEPAPPAPALVLVVFAGATAVAATLVNPYGTALYGYLAHTLGDHGRIAEWLPVPLWSTSHLPFELLVLATATIGVRWCLSRPERSARVDWRIAFLAVAAVYGLRHQRHTVLFAIVATPVLVVATEAVRRELVARLPALRPRRPVATAIAFGALAVACVQLTVVVARYARDGVAIRYARTEFPADAIAFVREHGIHGNMAVQFEWGGYTLQHLGDAARVFIDGRYEAAYPPAVMDDYAAFIDADPGWERVLDAYPTDVVLIDRATAVVPRLDARPDFVRVYADATTLLYVRRSPTNAAALDALTALARRTSSTPGDVVFP